MGTTNERLRALSTALEALTDAYEGGQVLTWSLPNGRSRVVHTQRRCGSIWYSTGVVERVLSERALKAARRCTRCKHSPSAVFAQWQTHLSTLRGSLRWMEGSGSTASRLRAGREELEAIRSLHTPLDELGLSYAAIAEATRSLEALAAEAEELVDAELSRLQIAARSLEESELSSLRARTLEAERSWASTQATGVRETVVAHGLAGCVRDETATLGRVLDEVITRVAERDSRALRELCQVLVEERTKVERVEITRLPPTTLDPGAFTSAGVLDLQAYARAAWEEASGCAREILATACEEVLEGALRAGENALEEVVLIHERTLYAYMSGEELECELARFEVRGRACGLVARCVPRIVAELVVAHCPDEAVIREVLDEPASVLQLALELADGELGGLDEAIGNAREAHL